MKLAPFLLLAALCVLAYAPALSIPLIEDDYPLLRMARSYGFPPNVSTIFHDSTYRLRSTNTWLMGVLWPAFGTHAMPYHAVSLLLHIVNTWLLYLFISQWATARPAAFWTAGFFAIHEGHQEAIMWFTAIGELLTFLFGMAALLCLMKASGRRAIWWQAAGTLLFALSVLSKESAVVFVALFGLVLLIRKESLWKLTPYVVVAGLAVLSVLLSRGQSFRFSDGSFSLHAPFWLVWPRTYVGMLWFWGWLASAVLVAWRARDRTWWFALAWIGIALTPYMFLTYMLRIPSRQTYLAGAGAALLFGLAVECLRDRFPTRRWLVAAVVTAMIVHNVVYLWTRKRAQFVARAAPTEELIALSRKTQGPIWVRCFPRQQIVAEAAVELSGGGELIWSAEEAARRNPVATFCK